MVMAVEALVGLLILTGLAAASVAGAGSPVAVPARIRK
jgi:hypothetical protein